MDPDQATRPPGDDRALARARVEAVRLRDRVRQSRLSATLAVFTVLAGFLVAFVTSPDTFADDSFGRLLSGELQQADGFGQWHDLAVGDDVLFERPVRTAGHAEVDVRQGTVTLGPASRAVALPGQVSLEQGRVLFEVDAFYLAVSPALVARGSGTWRMDADVNARVAVYEGSASASSGLARGPDRPAAPALRDWEQVALAAGAMGEVRPLAYQVTDPWDAEHAVDLLAVDEAVATTMAGIEQTYGAEPRERDFYEAFTVVDDGIELALDRFDVLDGPGFGPPADVLVAVLVSRLIEQRASLGFPQAVAEVDDLRADGATWGVVLARRDLGVADWVRTVDLSLREVQQLGDDAPAPAPAGNGNGSGNGSTPGGGPDPGATPSPRPTASPSPSPSGSPSPEPTEPEPGPDPCLDPPPNAPSCVEQTVDQLLELLDDLIPPVVRGLVPPVVDELIDPNTSPSTPDAAEDGVLDGVDGVVGGVLGVLLGFAVVLGAA